MFGGLFGKNKKRGGDEFEKLNPNIASLIISVVGARSIPLMPGAAQKAFKLSVDPKSEARDFVEVIESDEALSARVLKIANSVYFDRGKAADTIEESVTIIGINELRCLLSSTALSDMFPSSNKLRWNFWVNDVATGIIARSIAQRILPSKTEAAFLGGLMHDIGKLLLLQRVSGDYKQVMDQVRKEGCDFCQAEEQVFPFDHAEVGHLLADRWNFSPDLTAIIALHHKPWNQLRSKSEPTLPAIIKAADIIAHSLGLGHPQDFLSVRNAREKQLGEVWEIIQISASEQKDSLHNFQAIFDKEFDLYSGNKPKEGRDPYS